MDTRVIFMVWQGLEETPVSKYYDEAVMPDEMRRNFDVYERIEKLGISLDKRLEFRILTTHIPLSSFIFAYCPA